MASRTYALYYEEKLLAYVYFFSPLPGKNQNAHLRVSREEHRYDRTLVPVTTAPLLGTAR